MVSRERMRETSTEPAATGMRYFELYDALPVEGKALAYPCRYDKATAKWLKISAAATRYIYDRFKGSGGKAGDQVQAIWMPGSRRWEVIAPGNSGKVFCVTLGTLAHNGTVTVERLKRSGSSWVRSGETFVAHDIFFNTADTAASGFICTVVPYEGLQVIDAIYCKVNDWL